MRTHARVRTDARKDRAIICGGDQQQRPRPTTATQQRSRTLRVVLAAAPHGWSQSLARSLARTVTVARRRTHTESADRHSSACFRACMGSRTMTTTQCTAVHRSSPRPYKSTLGASHCSPFPVAGFPCPVSPLRSTAAPGLFCPPLPAESLRIPSSVHPASSQCPASIQGWPWSLCWRAICVC
jgi:hypothetical protein